MSTKYILYPLCGFMAMIIFIVTSPIIFDIVGNITGPEGVEAISELQNAMSDFTPVYGIGLALGVIIMFFVLATWLGGSFSSDEYTKPPELKSNVYIKPTIPKTSCVYCLRKYTRKDLEEGFCGCCGAPIKKRA